VLPQPSAVVVTAIFAIQLFVAPVFAIYLGRKLRSDPPLVATIQAIAFALSLASAVALGTMAKAGWTFGWTSLVGATAFAVGFWWIGRVWR